MHTTPALPVHLTKRHPLTGEPLQAVYVRDDGRVFWPIMGGAPDPEPAPTPAPAPTPTPAPAPAPAPAPVPGNGNAVDDKGNDLGFPAQTPVVEMKPEQAANYWRHQSQKHEGRYKNLAGDRSFDDVRKDLDEIADIRKSQQTPAEQQINEAREQGKAAAYAEAGTKAATAIFRAQLGTQGHTDDEINDLVANFNVANFVKDDGDVDTDALSTFAKRFTKAATADDKQRRRDFGGGDRGNGSGGGAGGGSIAAVIAERRAAREGKN